MNLPTLRPQSLHSEVNPAPPTSHLSCPSHLLHYVTSQAAGAPGTARKSAFPRAGWAFKPAKAAEYCEYSNENKKKKKKMGQQGAYLLRLKCLSASKKTFYLKKRSHYFLNTIAIHISALNRPPPCHFFMTGELLTGRWGVINRATLAPWWPYCVRDYRHPWRIWSALPPPHRDPSHLLRVAQHATHFHILHVLHHMGFSYMQTHLYTQTAC